MSSSTLSLPELDEYAETFIAQRLSTVSGVAQVNVYGAAKYAVRIQLDPKALATRAIGIDEVANGIAAGNVNLPTGILWGDRKSTRLNSSHGYISYAVFCLKKKTRHRPERRQRHRSHGKHRTC